MAVVHTDEHASSFGGLGDHGKEFRSFLSKGTIRGHSERDERTTFPTPSTPPEEAHLVTITLPLASLRTLRIPLGFHFSRLVLPTGLAPKAPSRDNYPRP